MTFRGYMVLECLMAMLILAIVLPMVMGHMRHMYRQLGRVMQHQKAWIERTDTHHLIQQDMERAQSWGGGCCFKTDEHDICYDIRNHRFRRRKKQRAKTRYFTHYWGQLAHWESLTCSSTEQQVTLTLQLVSGQTFNWVYGYNPSTR